MKKKWSDPMFQIAIFQIFLSILTGLFGIISIVAKANIPASAPVILALMCGMLSLVNVALMRFQKRIGDLEKKVGEK